MKRKPGWLALALINVWGCQTPPGASPPVSPPPRQSADAPAPRIKPSAARIIDSLPPCRPVSVTRFLAAIEAPEVAAPTNGEFRIPPAIPGAAADPLVVPEFPPNTPFAEQREAVRKIYKPLPTPPTPAFSPEQSTADPISLAELQQLAFDNSPVIKAALARVEQARGRVVQAGLYPNPQTGYQADSLNTADTAGYHGLFANQTIVTANKLEVRQSVEWQDVIKAEFALRQAEIDLATRVRRSVVRAMIAEERLKLAQELATLFARTYEGQIDLVAGGEAAAYEALQLRVFVVQTQNTIVEAGNAYVAAWRQLTADLNLPDFEPRRIQLSPETPLPQISFDEALEITLSRHTDLSIAFAQISRSEWDLHLQRITPIPDVDVGGVIQYDDTTPLNDVAFNVQVGVRLPLFDKNQGNIYRAESRLIEAHQNQTAAQNDLKGRLAEIHARLLTQQTLATNYREEILPDLVRTYRGIYERFREGADPVEFAEIVVTQQQLGQSLVQYLDLLEGQWLALVDLAEILQSDDMFRLQDGPEAAGRNCDPAGIEVPDPS